VTFSPIVYVGIYHCSVQEWVAVQDIFVSVHIGAGLAQLSDWMETEHPLFTSRQGFFTSPSHRERFCDPRTQRALQGMGEALLRQDVTGASSWPLTFI